MIAPTPFFADRGCHVRILEESKALKSLGNEITIHTYHNGRNIQGLCIKRIINIPWYRKLEAGPSYHMIYLDFFLLLHSLGYSYLNTPDIIHAHLHEGAFIGKICSRLRYKKIPLIFDIQGSLTMEMLDHDFTKRNSLPYKFFRFLEINMNKMADAIITSSSNLAEILKTEFDVDKEKIFVVPDGVDTSIFKPNYNTSTLQKNLGIPKNKRIIVYLGLLNEYQGIDYLLKAIPTILNKVSDVHFLVMGYPNVEKYKNIAKKLGILENITFTGRINYNEAPKYLALGDIAVSPKISRTEANGKIYNYMAMGLPTVVFDTPPNREILGDLGVYSKLGHYNSLADAIIILLTNEKLREELSRKVREKAVKDYSWKKVGEKIMNVYELVQVNRR